MNSSDSELAAHRSFVPVLELDPLALEGIAAWSNDRKVLFDDGNELGARCHEAEPEARPFSAVDDFEDAYVTTIDSELKTSHCIDGEWEVPV